LKAKFELFYNVYCFTNFISNISRQTGYVAISYPVTSLVTCRNLSSDLSAIKDLSKESLLEDLKSEEEVDSNLSK